MRRLQRFFREQLNKADLIRRFNEFVKREVPRLHLDYVLVITLEKEVYKISLTGVQNLSPCNHEEADTRIMYHCTLEDKPAVVIASDTDILVLMVHVFASRLPDHDWFLQTKKNQLVNVSKEAILEHVLKQEVSAVELLSNLGEHTHLSETSEVKLKRFLQIIIYGLYVLMYVLIFYL